MTTNTCAECGAILEADISCRDHFHQMLYWEQEDPEQVYPYHHLLVLCWHIQHPGYYTAEALTDAKRMLAEVLDEKLSGPELRKRVQYRIRSAVEKVKVTGAPASHPQPITWRMFCTDVTAAGIAAYPEQIMKWGETMLEDIRQVEAV